MGWQGLEVVVIVSFHLALGTVWKKLCVCVLDIFIYAYAYICSYIKNYIYAFIYGHMHLRRDDTQRNKLAGTS